MIKLRSFVILIFALLFSFGRFGQTQTLPDKLPSERDQTGPKGIAFLPGEPKNLLYDAGTVRFLVSSEDTHGSWSLVELTEMPGYHTNFHRHNHTDEAFYVTGGSVNGEDRRPNC